MLSGTFESCSSTHDTLDFCACLLCSNPAVFRISACSVVVVPEIDSVFYIRCIKHLTVSVCDIELK